MTVPFTRDVAAVLRSIRGAPRHALLVVLSLATGIGAVLTMAGVIDVLFLRAPMGIREPGRVVAIGRWLQNGGASYPDFKELSDVATAFVSVGAFSTQDFTVRAGVRALPVRGMLSSASLLSTLGTSPVRGRGFVADDDRPGAAPVALVTTPLAISQFGGVAAALGKSFAIAGKLFTVVGVLPPGFTAPDLAEVDVVLPLTNTPWLGGESALTSRDYHYLRLVGRLRDGISRARASAEVTQFNRLRAERTRDTVANRQPDVTPVLPLVEARRDPAAPAARVSVWISVLAAAMFLVGVLNALALEMVKAARRKKAVAIEIALGIQRRTLDARAIGEAVLVSVVALASALLVTNGAWRFLARSALGGRITPPAMTPGLIAFGASLAVVAAVVVAVPTLRNIRMRALRTELTSGAASMSRSVRRAFRVLLVAQIALALLLVSEASIFVLSLDRASRVSLGVRTDHLLVATVDLHAAGLTATDAATSVSRLVTEGRNIPGARLVGMTNAALGPAYITFPVVVTRDSPVADDGDVASLSLVTPGYLPAIGAHLISGRDFSDGDMGSASVIVSKRFVREHWPRRDPIGQCVKLGDASAPCGLVIGVIDDRRELVTDAKGSAEVFVPTTSPIVPSMLRDTFLPRELAIRLDGAPERAVGALQDVVTRIVPTLTAVRVRTGDEYMSPQYHAWRLGAEIVGAFGVITVLLATIGVYGVASRSTESRQRELAIRKVLGADDLDIMRLVLTESAMTAGAGIVLGLVGTVIAARLTQQLAYGVTRLDPQVYALPTVLLFVVSLAATLPAAWRGSRARASTVLHDA